MILNQTLLNLLKDPDHYGLNLFIVGVLFMLSSYHFFLFIQNKKKTYLYYHFFTGFTLLYLIFDHTDCCNSTNKTNLAFYLIIPLQWIYNTFYVLFIKEFTDFKSQRKKWNRFLNFTIFFSFFTILTLLGLTIIIGDNSIMLFAHTYFFLPIVTIISVISLALLSHFKSNLKYYALIGSLLFLVLSWIAQYYEITGNRVTGFFYLAIILENLFFALGLGFKQKQIALTKENLKNDLIFQLEENQKLKDQLNVKLKNEIINQEKKLKILVSESEEKNKKQLRLEYEHKLLDLKMTALISQMNPHFLFNALNSIKSFIIQNDTKEAVYYLNKFSSLIRTSLNNSRKHFISLQEELDFIRIYVEIENIRLSKSIEFNINIKDVKNISNIIIPPMLLHPFIENAIWHGLSTKIGDKKISISIYKEKNKLCIKIEDNGIGRAKANEILKAKMFHKESLGLKLTNERLLVFEKISGKKNHLEFIDKYDDSGKSCGTIVILKI